MKKVIKKEDIYLPIVVLGIYLSMLQYIYKHLENGKHLHIDKSQVKRKVKKLRGGQNETTEIENISKTNSKNNLKGVDVNKIIPTFTFGELLLHGVKEGLQVATKFGVQKLNDLLPANLAELQNKGWEEVAPRVTATIQIANKALKDKEIRNELIKLAEEVLSVFQDVSKRLEPEINLVIDAIIKSSQKGLKKVARSAVEVVLETLEAVIALIPFGGAAIDAVTAIGSVLNIVSGIISQVLVPISPVVQSGIRTGRQLYSDGENITKELFDIGSRLKDSVGKFIQSAQNAKIQQMAQNRENQLGGKHSKYHKYNKKSKGNKYNRHITNNKHTKKQNRMKNKTRKLKYNKTRKNKK